MNQNGKGSGRRIGEDRKTFEKQYELIFGRKKKKNKKESKK